LSTEDKKRWQATPEWWETLKPFAREMRRNPTSAEGKLWGALRKNRLGVKFRRQHAIERFIVDFYCADANLVVELDGEVHHYTYEEDQLRQQFLESLGLRVLRIDNDYIFENIDGALWVIQQVLNGASLDEFDW